MIFEQVIVRLRPVIRTNRGGDTVADWTLPPSRETVRRMSVQPQTQDEVTTAHANVRTQRCRVYSAPGLDVDIFATDRVEYQGRTWEVDGPIARWPDPFTGATHHVEFVIRRDEGG